MLKPLKKVNVPQTNEITIHDPEVFRVGMLTTNDVNVMDTANTFEAEGLLEYLYALVSIGDDLTNVLNDLKIPKPKLDLILRSSPSRRKRLLEAKSSQLAEGSITSLAHFKTMTYMDRETASAAGHHRATVDMAAKLMTTQTEADTGPKVIVNNNVVIGENREPPPLPPELEGIIDVSPE